MKPKQTRQTTMAKIRTNNQVNVQTDEPIDELNGFHNHVKRGANAAIAELERGKSDEYLETKKIIRGL